MIADITIFNPETVTDNATYKAGEHLLPSTGIPYVIVNGHIVVRDSKAQKLNVGQPIRYTPESKGRHVPATTKQWLKNFSIDDGGIINPNTRSSRDASQPTPKAELIPAATTQVASVPTGTRSEGFFDRRFATMSTAFAQIDICPVHSTAHNHK